MSLQMISNSLLLPPGSGGIQRDEEDGVGKMILRKKQMIGFVCFLALLLVLGFQIVWAVPIDQSSPNGVAAVFFNCDDPVSTLKWHAWILSVDGSVCTFWRDGNTMTWEDHAQGEWL